MLVVALGLVVAGRERLPDLRARDPQVQPPPAAAAARRAPRSTAASTAAPSRRPSSRSRATAASIPRDGFRSRGNFQDRRGPPARIGASAPPGAPCLIRRNFPPAGPSRQRCRASVQILVCLLALGVGAARRRAVGAPPPARATPRAVPSLDRDRRRQARHVQRPEVPRARDPRRPLRRLLGRADGPAAARAGDDVARRRARARADVLVTIDHSKRVICKCETSRATQARASRSARAACCRRCSQYLTQFRAFRARFPWVTEFVTWDETNYYGEATYDKEALVAASGRACRRRARSARSSRPSSSTPPSTRRCR